MKYVRMWVNDDQGRALRRLDDTPIEGEPLDWADGSYLLMEEKDVDHDFVRDGIMAAIRDGAAAGAYAGIQWLVIERSKLMDEFKPITQKALNCNLFHITKDDAYKLKLMQIWLRNGADTHPVVLKHNHGFFVFCWALDPLRWRQCLSEYRSFGLSEQLLELMNIANDHLCVYLHLYPKGQVYPELQIHKWGVSQIG